MTFVEIGVVSLLLVPAVCALVLLAQRVGKSRLSDLPPNSTWRTEAPACQCATCVALRTNPMLRMTPQLSGVVQSVLVIVASGGAPALVGQFGQMRGI